MQVDNPFAAPAPPPHREIAHGRSLAWWMTFLGILHYIGAAFLVLGSVLWFAALSDQIEEALVMLAVAVVVLAYLVAQARWLCRGAHRIRIGDVADIVAGLHDIGLHFLLLAIPQVFLVALWLI